MLRNAVKVASRKLFRRSFSSSGATLGKQSMKRMEEIFVSEIDGKRFTTLSEFVSHMKNVSTDFDQFKSSCKHLKWQKPETGCHSVSVHAIYSAVYSAAGVILRSSTGEPLLLLWEPILAHDINYATLAAIDIGIGFTRELGIDRVVIESSDEETIQQLQKEMEETDLPVRLADALDNPCYPGCSAEKLMKFEIRRGLYNLDYRVRVIYEGANKVAEKLARMGVDNQNRRYYLPNELDEIPEVKKLVEADKQ